MSNKKQIVRISKKYLTAIVGSLLVMAFNFFSNAQNQIQSQSLSLTNTTIPPHTIDVIDLIQKTSFGSIVVKSDTIAKQQGKLYISVLPAIGYSLNTAWAASVGANGAFYTDAVDKENLSVVNISPTITIKNQFITPVQSNIWTTGNNYNILGNWMFYHFPENTYGLGGHTNPSQADPIDYNLILLRQTILKSIGADIFAGIGADLDYHYQITEKKSVIGIISDFDKYGKANHSSSSGITLNFLYDTRRNPINPSIGNYLNIVFRQNLQIIGSDLNWNSLLIDARKYISLNSDTRYLLCFWSYNWLTLGGNPPYLDLPSTAWDTYSNQGRGYIQSRFRGKDLLAFETEYRFPLTHNQLVGGVVFANLQSVTDWPSNKFEVVWPGFGAGLRMKINKHSNTNVALDYAIGLEGSRGFFVNLGEVF